jgi:hypothetical protein
MDNFTRKSVGIKEKTIHPLPFLDILKKLALLLKLKRLLIIRMTLFLIKMVHNDTCIKRSQISYNVNLHMKYDCPR